MKKKNFCLNSIKTVSMLLAVLLLFSGCGSKGDFSSLNDDYAQEAVSVFGHYDGIFALCNYKTGELICCACISDGENISAGDNFDSDENSFLYGQYVPGSTMKIVTTVAALRNYDKVRDFTYNCRQQSDYLNGNISCQKAHGTVELSEAFGYSCNCFYGSLALTLGRDQVTSTAESLGFNKSLDFNGIKINSSSFVLQEGDDTDFAWSCCGQASALINPAHYLALMSTIANGGECAIPGMKLSMDTKEAQRMHSLLRSNVESYYGDNRFNGVSVCGKTGTAEITGQNSNSLFVGFCENEDTPYSFICIVEEGGARMNTAIEFSSEIINYIIGNEGENNG